MLKPVVTMVFSILVRGDSVTSFKEEVNSISNPHLIEPGIIIHNQKSNSS